MSPSREFAREDGNDRGDGIAFRSNHHQYNNHVDGGFLARGRKRVESGKTDLPSVYPLLAEEWHPTKNGALTPSAVSSKSTKVVWI